MRLNFIIVILCSISINAIAQAPKVGRGAAAKYLSKDKVEESPSKSKVSDGDNFLSILVGPFVSSASYAWKGNDKRTGIGKNNLAVTYLFDQWNGIDTNIRIELTEFGMDDEKPSKLSLLPLWTLPMAETHFPLYFGLGAGVGIFLKQIEQESNLTLEYQAVTGLRFPNLLESSGFIVELGFKNHLHLLSDGQFSGTSLSVGAIFNF